MCSPRRAASSALREEGDGAKMLAAASCLYFYPRPPRGGRQEVVYDDGTYADISIHALREEGDWSIPLWYGSRSISIHALREEGDGLGFPVQVRSGVFLSTPSARRATYLSQESRDAGEISIHSLREEDDQTRRAIGRGRPSDFYPRPPRGGRQLVGDLGGQVVQISIHALREEGDTLTTAAATSWLYFYPRPP